MAEQALADLKVVEWGSFISAPFCTKLLADLGAEVVKIEPPHTGEEARRHGPFPGDTPDIEKSGLFLYLNINKFGVTLAPQPPAGREIFLKLLEDADIFVHNYPYPLVKELKLDFESVKEINPKLIMLSLSPFGLTGPYKDWKAYDINTCALGGISAASGYPEREPLAPPMCQAHYQAGLQGALVTMISLFNRDRTGEGSHIDLAEAQCWATFHIGHGAQAFLDEEGIRTRTGFRVIHQGYTDAVYPCKDGYVCIDTPQNRQWQKFLGIMGNPAWADDPIFKDRIKTSDEYATQADAYLMPWLMQHTKEEIFQLCQSNGVPAAPIRTVEDVANDEHLKERGYFVEIDHPAAGKLKYPGAGYQLSKTPFLIQRAAPRLGEHNEEIYCEKLGYSKADLDALRKEGTI
ncbi:MAG: CoA transferase [Chloroflexota bacterium]